MPQSPALILASGSRYRAEMLRRLGVPFTTKTSGIDETGGEHESADDLVRRLAQQKARHVAKSSPDALVIGADQVAILGRDVLGKPGDHSRAVAQLARMSGRQVRFLSGIALLGSDYSRIDVVATTLRFRNLSETEIERYVERDQPFDCAGAMRSESLGISLLSSLESDDPTALIGLPLIRLSEWLRECGFEVP